MRKPPDPTLVALSPFDLLLVLLYGECRSEAIEGQVAVANVVRNRLNDGRWGDTYHKIILAPAQFSCLWSTLDARGFKNVIAFAKRVQELETFTLPERQLRLVVQGLFSDALRDNARGATHYYANYISPPFWSAPPARQVAKHGRHLFFAGVK